MAIVNPHLEIIESRINELEKLVFGEFDKDSIYAKCSDSLTNIHNKLTAVVTSRKPIQEIYGQLPTLRKYLDPVLADELTLSQSAKASIILCQEDFIKKQVEELEKLKSLESCLDSEHLKAVPNLSGKLQALSSVHISLQDASVELTDDIKSLLLSYNNTISLLMKQFVQWDELVTRLEMAKQAKNA